MDGARIESYGSSPLILRPLGAPSLLFFIKFVQRLKESPSLTAKSVLECKYTTVKHC
jgi:hypothetical protein